MELCNLPIEIQGKILSYLYFKPKPYDEIHFSYHESYFTFVERTRTTFQRENKNFEISTDQIFYDKNTKTLRTFQSTMKYPNIDHCFSLKYTYITTKIYNYIMFEYHLN